MTLKCSNISLLVIGAAMLMYASSSKLPKVMSRRDLRSLGTVIIGAGIVMIAMEFCKKKGTFALSPAPVDQDVDRDLSNNLLDESNVSLECCDKSPYSTSTGCVCNAQEFVKNKNCAAGSVGEQF